jgi:hypothetical protein
VALDCDPVPLEVRRFRVAHGSRRKRDLAAVAMAEELAQLERLASAQAVDCRELLRSWIAARRRLRRAVPPSTYRLWLRPLRPTAAEGSTLFLIAPVGVCAWIERRYFTLIAECLEGTRFDRVEFIGSAG